MSLLGLIIGIVLIGIVLWAINAYIPMEPTIKKILNVVVIIVVILWVLFALGVMDDLRAIRVPRV